MTFITQNDGQFPYFDAQLGRPLWKGKNVLDFGGNIGNILHHPTSTIDHDKYWSIDVSRDAIDVGQKAAPEAHFIFYDRYNFEFNPKGIRQLPVPDTGKKFAFILALSVFTHTSQAEMIEMVGQLETLLDVDGRLAFTFLDPHYIPADSDVCNLQFYLQRRAVDLSPSDINALIKTASGASKCTIADGGLEIGDEGLKKIQGIQDDGYLIYYTPQCISTIFPQGQIVEPVEPFPRQHCCIINH
jgi:hypothetical protein